MNKKGRTMDDIILQTKNLSKSFKTSSGIINAVRDVNLKIRRGECYGLVGESGCGKSTLSSLIACLQKPDSGTVEFNSTDIFSLSGKELKDLRKKLQIIFQDPYSSLNPQKKIVSILREPLVIHKIEKSKHRQLQMINEMRTLTGLPPDVLEKYPSQLSGGQRQRIAIASSMILHPEFLILDESVSSLDILIQAQILNILKLLQKNLKMTFLFISHNLNVVAYMADRIGVMKDGQIIEEADTETLISNPVHPYTQKLLNAADLNYFPK